MEKILFVLFIGLCSCTSHGINHNSSDPKNGLLKLIDTTLKVLPQSDSIKKYSDKMKRFYRFTEPSKFADEWFLPFDIHDKSDFKLIQIISDFGAYRSGHVRGHRHSGIDIVPVENKDTVRVFASCSGTVCLVRPTAPNKTVIIKHRFIDSTIVYSSYIHLKEIYVENGQEVNQNTVIGVLYTREEALKYNGNYDHLHFEIKKRIDDYCCASWLCMSQIELEEYFINPLKFLQTHFND